MGWIIEKLWYLNGVCAAGIVSSRQIAKTMGSGGGTGEESKKNRLVVDNLRKNERGSRGL